MSKSLAFRNGDLIIGPGRAFESVSGKEKLLQDLKLWILERVGTDPATPSYGSNLDSDQIIGEMGTADTLNRIRIDVLNLLQKYQNMQYQKLRAETIQYAGKTTLDKEEIIQEVTSVDVKAIDTTALVQVFITTLTGNVLKLTLPVEQVIT